MNEHVHFSTGTFLLVLAMYQRMCATEINQSISKVSMSMSVIWVRRSSKQGVAEVKSQALPFSFQGCWILCHRASERAAAHVTESFQFCGIYLNSLKLLVTEFAWGE